MTLEMIVVSIVAILGLIGLVFTLSYNYYIDKKVKNREVIQ